MYRNAVSSILTFLMLLGALSSPALGISVSSSTGSGQGSVGVSGGYLLDDSTSLFEETVIGAGVVVRESQASGSGENIMSQGVSGEGYSVRSEIGSSGSLLARASLAASGSGAGISQSVAADGSSGAAVSGSAKESSAGQAAGVGEGSISTTQSIAAGMGVASSQRTSLYGESGAIGSRSASAENEMAVDGIFSGQSSLDADLSSASADRAYTAGSAVFSGVETLGEEALGNVASGDTLMSVDGLYMKPGDIGSFSIQARNQERASVDAQVPAGTALPQYTADGGRKEAYVLAGWKWTQENPAIKLWVKDDSNLRNEGLTAASVRNALAAAANTWDGAVHKNLFADGPAGVEVSTKVSADKYDGKNVMAFTPFGSGMSGALAYARTYYGYPKAGSMYSAKESDLCFNTGYSWWANTANPPSYWKIDVQSVATHELGHTIGLGDLYGKSQFAQDTRQMMHYYNGVKRTLGNGDKTGAYLLYG